MIRIGLTGGIASGKSTVVSMLKELGAYIVDCDVIAREVVEPGTEGLVAICQAFGPQAAGPDGTLDRSYIADVIFKDPKAKQQLNDMLHPLIWNRVLAIMDREAKGGVTRVLILDMPLLFELKYDRYVDEAWLVYVDPETQLQRLMARNHYTESEALSRVHAQLPIDEKCSLANVIIDNTGTLEETKRQVHNEWAALTDRFHHREGKS